MQLSGEYTDWRTFKHLLGNKGLVLHPCKEMHVYEIIIIEPTVSYSAGIWNIWENFGNFF